MKRFLLAVVVLSFGLSSHAQIIKTWTGAAAPDLNWSTAGNWDLGVPGILDTAVFDGNITTGTVIVDVTPTISGLNLINTANVTFSATVDQTITIGNFASILRVFYIESGSLLILGSGFGVSIQTYGNGVTTTANIDGTLVFGQGNSAWTINQLPVGGTSLTNVIVGSGGLVRVASNNTSAGGVLLNSTVATTQFLSGSEFRWQRNGDAGPEADFQNGSKININVTSVVMSTMMSLSSSATYNGLLIWNCPTQTISGSSAKLLPAANSSMDSVRVVSTGASDTLLLWNEPAGFTIGHLEVQGGVLEISAPVSGPGTGSITNELKITGGRVIGNATFAGDGGSAYPMTLTVNGNLTMTGATDTLNFSNRPIGNLPGGTFNLIVKGHVSQFLPSSIIATTPFSSPQQEDSLILNGAPAQNLQLDNMTGNINLKADNPNPNGVNMQNHIILPYGLILAQGYVAPGGYTLTVASSLIKQLAATPAPKVVTGGAGYLKLTNVTSNGNFYIGGSSSSYNPVFISSGNGADYYARVIDTITPAIAFPTYGINRTWNIFASANTPGVTVTFQYAGTDANPFCTPQPRPMEILINTDPVTPGPWSIIPGNTGIMPVGGDPYTVTTATPIIISNNSEVHYVLGRDGGWILPIDCIISTRAQKRNNTGIISWAVNSSSDVRNFEVQRSVNNSGFRTIGIVDPVANQTDFSFTDAALANGTNLYRIKVNGITGASKYSNTVAIIQNSNDLIITTVAPNPVHNNALLTVSTGRSTVVDFKIYNMSGSLVKQWQTAIAEGNNTIEMNVSELAAGMYSIFASNSDANTVSRFVKQ